MEFTLFFTTTSRKQIPIILSSESELTAKAEFITGIRVKTQSYHPFHPL